MFRRIGDWFRNFMLGRYGSDKLNTWLLIGGVVHPAGVVHLPDVLPEYRSPPPGKCGLCQLLCPSEGQGPPLLPLPQVPPDRPGTPGTRQDQHPLPQMQRALHPQDLRTCPDHKRPKGGVAFCDTPFLTQYTHTCLPLRKRRSKRMSLRGPLGPWQSQGSCLPDIFHPPVQAAVCRKSSARRFPTIPLAFSDSFRYSYVGNVW